MLKVLKNGEFTYAASSRKLLFQKWSLYCKMSRRLTCKAIYYDAQICRGNNIDENGILNMYPTRCTDFQLNT